MPIVENPARITVVPSSQVCTVFQIRGKQRPYRQYPKPLEKKRAGPLSAIRLLPDDHPQPYKMRNIGCPVLSHYTAMLHFCQHFLKKNTKFLKKIDSNKTPYFFVLQQNTYDYVFFVSSLSASSSATRSMPTK